MESLIPDELSLLPSCVSQVLDQGRIVEFDQPYLLLQSQASVFGVMVEEAGKSEAAKLFAIAKTKYLEMNPVNDSSSINDDGSSNQSDWELFPSYIPN